MNKAGILAGVVVLAALLVGGGGVAWAREREDGQAAAARTHPLLAGPERCRPLALDQATWTRWGDGAASPPGPRRSRWALPCAPRACPKPWSLKLSVGGWVTGFEGDTTFDGQDFEFDQSPLDVLAHFDEILEDLEFMFAGRIELQYRRWWARFEGMGIGLGQEIPLKLGGVTATNDMTVLIGNAVLGYQFLDRRVRTACRRGRWRADAFAGARVHRVDVRMGTPAITAIDDSATWADPVVGARLRHVLDDRWIFTAEGDVGGFGVGSEFTWRSLLTVGWSPAKWFTLSVGWLWLYTDYASGSGPDRFRWEVLNSGPLVVFGFNF